MVCTNCGQPATLTCSVCSRCPRLAGDASPVHYCGTACQEIDSEKHKEICLRLRDRLKLYRVASLAQQLFYLCQELTWYTFDITRVDHDPIEEEYFKEFPDSPRTQKSLNLHGRVSSIAPIIFLT